MSHKPNALVVYASDDDDDDQIEAGVSVSVGISQQQPTQPQPEATVEDAMDLDDDGDLAPMLGPQLPSRDDSTPAAKSSPSQALPALVLDTSSWVIPVVENVTDMYTYSDFVAKFLHGRQIATSEPPSSSRPSTPVDSNPRAARGSDSPQSAASSGTPSLIPSTSYSAAAAHYPLFATLSLTPAPPAPPLTAAKVDPALEAKLKQWAHLKLTQGQHFTDAVLRAPDAGNPAVLHKLVDMFGIDEYGSQFPPMHPRERSSTAISNGESDREPEKRGAYAMELGKRQAEEVARAQQQRNQESTAGTRSSIAFVRGRTGDQPSDRW